MKPAPVFLFLLCATFSMAHGAPRPAGPATKPSAAPPARTIKDIRGLPRESLSHMVSRPLYRSLEVSPVEAYVAARAVVYSGGTAQAKIIHSEAGGAYDKMLLQMANGYRFTGGDTLESRMPTDTLTVHLLVFGIADGKMAVCFPHNDDARYVGRFQYADAWIGILKNGAWTTVSHKR